MAKFSTCAKRLTRPNRWRLPTSRGTPATGTDPGFKDPYKLEVVDGGSTQRMANWSGPYLRSECSSGSATENVAAPKCFGNCNKRVHHGSMCDFRVFKVVITNIFLQFRVMKANEQTVSGAGYFHRPRLLRTRWCSLASDTHEENTTSA